MILGCDISHRQGSADLTAIRASGREFVVLRTTDSVGTGDADQLRAYGYRG